MTLASSRPEYGVWSMLKQRCGNPRNAKYDRYGGRGIRVCDRWSESFAAFFADMGPRPSAGHSIDRIDNDGNYEPGNCRWATAKEQSANRAISFGNRGLSSTVEFTCEVCGATATRNRKYKTQAICSHRCTGIKAGRASGVARAVSAPVATGGAQRGFVELLVALVVCLVALVAVGALHTWATRHSCEDKATLMGVPHEVRGGTCMVQVDGHWLPLANVRSGGAQ